MNFKQFLISIFLSLFSVVAAANYNIRAEQSAFIAGGIYHTLAIKSDATVLAWGSDDSGQLGNDISFSDSDVPVAVANISNVKAVAAGGYHSIALTNNGDVYTWGSNTHGQLGYTGVTYQPTPQQLTGLTEVIAIAGGAFHTVVLTKIGTVWAWGWNDDGQLGNNGTGNQVTDSSGTALTNIVAIATGHAHTIAVDNDGFVYTWGANGFGQLGNNLGSSNVPVKVSSLTNIVGVSAGANHSMALTQNGAVYVWGSNSDGQLGFTSNSTPNPTPNILIASNAAAMAAGYAFSLVLDNDGAVWSCGANTDSQLGRTGTETTITKSQLTTGGTSVAAGAYHSINLKDNNLYIWGDDHEGQLGDNTTLSDQLTPVQITGEFGVTTVVALLGDINGDRNVNLADVIAGLQICVGVEPGTPNRLVLAADFGTSGLHGYYDNQTWSQLTDKNPSEIIAADINGDGIDELFATFTNYGGLYIWGGSTWASITSATPEGMIAWDNQLAVDFGDQGGLKTYKRANDGTGIWELLTDANPAPGLMASANVNGMGSDELVVYFDENSALCYISDGGTWSCASLPTPDDLIEWNNNLVADLGNNGVYTFTTNDGWTSITDSDPYLIVAGTGGVACGFPGGGLARWDGTDWDPLTPSEPEAMMWQGSKLVADFGDGGVHSYDTDVPGWVEMILDNPDNMIVTDINGDSQEEVTATFSNGVSYYDDGTDKWINITEGVAEKLVAIKSSNINQNDYKAADVNGDGKIGLEDVIYVLEKEAELR